MLWVILWWVGGISGALVAVWMLVAAAGLDGARRGLRGRRGVLSCGACGHEAVTPDRIAACPECGALYAKVGLVTPRAGLRYGPPTPIVLLLVLSGVVLGSALLAPPVGMAANLRAIGGAQIESRRMTTSFQPEVTGASVPPARLYWLGFHRDILTARTPGQWSANPPLLRGSMEVEIVVGSTSQTPASVPAPTSAPRFTLRLDSFSTSDWQLVDGSDVEHARGSDGPEVGIAALFDAAGLSSQGSAWPGAQDELDMALRIVTLHAAAGGGQITGLPSPGLYGLRRIGTSTTVNGTSTFHAISPWGIAAGVATPALLSGAALGLLGLIWWLRRRMVG